MDGQVFVSGVEPAHAPDDAAASGRRPRRSQAVASSTAERNWARGAASARRRLSLSTPTGRESLRVAGLFAFKSGLDFGGYGLASMPLAVPAR